MAGPLRRHLASGLGPLRLRCPRAAPPALAALAPLTALALLVGAGAGPTPAWSAKSPPGETVRCPLKSTSAIPSGEAWAFHETGTPSPSHPHVTSVYIHGRGDWGGGRGSGTICQADRQSGGPAENIVLTIAGSAQLSTGITRLGHPGAGLVLKASVAASSDPGCRAGSHATVTIFASYYEGHHDSVQLHFATGCTGYDETFTGSQLYALIAENGHEVK